VPWLQRRTGKDGAATALAATFSGVETQSFTPNAFLEGEGVVVVLFDTEFTVNATGKPVVENDGVHIWRFDDEGKVSRFRHRIDTHQQELACRE
jgi:ketosteroid isomerase-like protein